MSISSILNYRIKRRTALTAAGSFAGLSALGLGVNPGFAKETASAISPAAPHSNIRFVVTDQRHPQSLAFAQGYATQGSQRLEVTDGLTVLWQQSLEPLWRERSGKVAGLTTRAVCECLAEQARSHAIRARVLDITSVAGDGHPDNLVSWIIG